MELGGHHIPPADGRGEGLAVGAGRGGPLVGHVRHAVAVHEVDAGVVPRIEQGAVAGGQGVPAHVGDLEAAIFKAGDCPREQPQALEMAVFVAVFEHHLHAQADAQDWLACTCSLIQRVIQVRFVNAIHCILKSAYTRKDDMTGGRYDLWTICDNGLISQVFKSLLHTAQVTHTIVDNRNHAEPSFAIL